MTPPVWRNLLKLKAPRTSVTHHIQIESVMEHGSDPRKISYASFDLSRTRQVSLMRSVYEAIASSLERRKDELIEAEKQPSDDPVEVLNDIITPLFAIAEQKAKREGWNAETSRTPNAPRVSNPTVEIKFWPDHEEQASAASVMAYPSSNEFIDSGLMMTYSVTGRNLPQQTRLISLDQCNPTVACSIMKEMIRKALGLDSLES